MSIEAIVILTALGLISLFGLLIHLNPKNEYGTREFAILIVVAPLAVAVFGFFVVLNNKPGPVNPSKEAERTERLLDSAKTSCESFLDFYKSLKSLDKENEKTE